MAAVSHGMKHRRRRALVHDIESVTPWYERYCARANFLREKRRSAARRTRRRGKEVALYAAIIDMGHAPFRARVET